MSEKFVASNGMVLAPHVDGSVRWEAGFNPKVVTAALREFFLHERDTELGRWRERPGCTTVVYPNGADVLGNRCVIVLFEPIAGMTMVYENKIPENLYGDAARNYFTAHPEPKPWHDAKPGEVWVITTSNVADEVALVVTGSSKFRYADGVCIPLTYGPIETGRRIFPEVVSDDS